MPLVGLKCRAQTLSDRKEEVNLDEGVMGGEGGLVVAGVNDGGGAGLGRENDGKTRLAGLAARARKRLVDRRATNARKSTSVSQNAKKSAQ